ncbi:hypothetical protein MHY29_03570 [Micrococcus sp. ACRRV]|uniref:hypothetical protein n=1 Tax=Micrococcus sp. ACRRV TaxID=2918203 RepID=UPI001EF2A1F5|nr:hypothetical protein [Micrococcus sp. ACRRV]MCG7421921.1 hypothetical protein [Micrococcus sp. ACRRV]
MPAGSFFWLSMLLIVFGIVSLFFYGSDVKSFLAYQVEPIQLVGVFALLLCVNVVHELAHAVTLSAQGGRPRSMGFMIIYFMPAFYCDVSLSWALSNRRARFWVAAAGPITQASMGGIFSIIGWRFDVPFLATTGLLAYLQAMVNCYPFLKFDGYVALVAYREKPFLMQSALTTLSARLRGRLFGTSVSNQDENDGRLLLFGLCAWISVATCVIFASWYVISLFASIPLISGSLLLFLLGWFGVVCTSWVRGGLREARRQSVSTFRQWAATLGIIAVFTTLLALPVTRSEGAMWWRGPNGGMYLSAAALGASGIELGDSYQLHSNGFAPIYCGDAKVTSIDQGEAPLDYSFMVPMDLSVESTVGVLNPTARSQECNGGVATRSGETVPLIVSVMQTIFGR